MPRPILLAVLPAMALAACASPDVVGQQVGQSLYGASVATGHALAVAGDRTGQALQSAGSGIRNAVNPQPPQVIYAPPPDLPPPYVPDGYAPGAPDGYTPGAPISAEPLSDPGQPAPGLATPPQPALGY